MQPPPNIKLNVHLAFKETDFNEKFSVATFPVEYFIMKVSQEKKKKTSCLNGTSTGKDKHTNYLCYKLNPCQHVSKRKYLQTDRQKQLR